MFPYTHGTRASCILMFAEPLYSLSSLFVLYLSVNWAGSYTKHLTERAQRKAFLETRRSLETRFRTQQENERQVGIRLYSESNICLTN